MKELQKKIAEVEKLEGDLAFLRNAAENAKPGTLKINAGDNEAGLRFEPIGQYDCHHRFIDLLGAEENRDIMQAFLRKVARRGQDKLLMLQAELSAIMIDQGCALKAELKQGHWLDCQGAQTGRVNSQVESQAGQPRATTVPPEMSAPYGKPAAMAMPVPCGSPQTMKVLAEMVSAVPSPRREEILFRFSATGKLDEIPLKDWPALWSMCVNAAETPDEEEE